MKSAPVQNRAGLRPALRTKFDIILHELMHLREHNHSRRFWKQVESMCPDYKVAEKWLK